MLTERRHYAAMLRRAGLRVTAPRLSVLAALAGGDGHHSVEAVVRSVRAHVGDTSSQTVYNVLRTLTEAGLARRIEPAGSPGLYELRVRDNHHHAVCRRCGSVADIPCGVGVAPCLEPSETHGYVIDEAEVIYWGYCPECVAAAAVPSGGAGRADGGRPASGDRAPESEHPESRASGHPMEPAREEQDRRV